MPISKIRNAKNADANSLENVIDIPYEYICEKHRLKTSGVAAFVGISRWKRKRIKQFFIGSPNAIFCKDIKTAIRHIRKTDAAKNIAIWPSRVDKNALTAIPNDIGITRIEDGFIRSNGLGAALTQACSIVVDKAGIYYDPSKPSDLENILNNSIFSSVELQRAEHIQKAIITEQISKYNLQEDSITLPTAQHKILVIGQVEGDQSVILGSGKSMYNFLSKIRTLNPQSMLIYKPHPDVSAGLRNGGLNEEQIDDLCDIVVQNIGLESLYAQVDEVHVLTSLTGFEALLRGCNVHVHGMPFYAGWGLTKDYANLERRERSLSLNHLIAGSLIEYPLYCDPQTGLACSPESLISHLSKASRANTSFMRQLIGRAALTFSRNI